MRVFEKTGPMRSRTIMQQNRHFVELVLFASSRLTWQRALLRVDIGAGEGERSGIFEHAGLAGHTTLDRRGSLGRDGCSGQDVGCRGWCNGRHRALGLSNSGSGSGGRRDGKSHAYKRQLDGRCRSWA